MCEDRVRLIVGEGPRLAADRKTVGIGQADRRATRRRQGEAPKPGIEGNRRPAQAFGECLESVAIAASDDTSPAAKRSVGACLAVSGSGRR